MVLLIQHIPSRSTWSTTRRVIAITGQEANQHLIQYHLVLPWAGSAASGVEVCRRHEGELGAEPLSPTPTIFLTCLGDC